MKGGTGDHAKTIGFIVFCALWTQNFDFQWGRTVKKIENIKKHWFYKQSMPKHVFWQLLTAGECQSATLIQNELNPQRQALLGNEAIWKQICHSFGRVHLGLKVPQPFSRRLSARRLNGFSGDAQGDEESINPYSRLKLAWGYSCFWIFFDFRWYCIGF